MTRGFAGEPEDHVGKALARSTQVFELVENITRQCNEIAPFPSERRSASRSSAKVAAMAARASAVIEIVTTRRT